MRVDKQNQDGSVRISSSTGHETHEWQRLPFRRLNSVSIDRSIENLYSLRRG